MGLQGTCMKLIEVLWKVLEKCGIFVSMNMNIKRDDRQVVWLEPIEHVYIHRDTQKHYKSVTTTLASVEPHFDADAVSLAISKQNDKAPAKNPLYVGKTQEQILDYWQELNDTANEYGTHIHETIETYLLKKKFWFPKDELQQAAIAGYESLKVDEGQMMYPERIMFSEYYELAGTADLVIDIDDVFFDVGDWKTNKAFHYWNQFGNQTMLKPFEHIQNCQYGIYSLQLSVYAYMYELEFPHKKCRHIWIGYWDKETTEMRRIPIPYLKHDAKRLLELHKYNTQMAI